MMTLREIDADSDMLSDGDQDESIRRIT